MSFTLWFTGIPCSGKTTLSRRIHQILRSYRIKVELMDGDFIRTNFAPDLGFTRKDREINVRALGYLSHLLNQKGEVSVVAAIAPYASTREKNRRLLARYIEVFCQCPIEVAEKRDVKGLYALARAGKIKNFTGISDPYEEPRNPEIVVFTYRETVAESVAKILDYLEKNQLIPRRLRDAALITPEEYNLQRSGSVD